ncbi:hypothetical protein [Rummeliibacillus sp. SL167]|uniref:hypothetical protein n=1 Tax=Rummeliibacillus sp. SL167 TaxID=2579792 RepID=UPI0011B6B94A|nr:hypothetical protein [Rummeliibacillus sp. SL167]
MENIVIERLLKVLKGKVSVQEVENLLEKPKYEYLGDIAFPCFMLAKQFRKVANGKKYII